MRINGQEESFSHLTSPIKLLLHMVGFQYHDEEITNANNCVHSSDFLQVGAGMNPIKEGVEKQGKRSKN